MGGADTVNCRNVTSKEVKLEKITYILNKGMQIGLAKLGDGGMMEGWLGSARVYSTAGHPGASLSPPQSPNYKHTRN